jgi:hypothetical protein
MIFDRAMKQQEDKPVSVSRQLGAVMRQQDKPWEKVGMSRATWFRHGKPTKPRKRNTVHDRAKAHDASSTRSFQRMMRVSRSELADWTGRGLFSIAQADRILSDPERLRTVLDYFKDFQRGPA